MNNSKSSTGKEQEFKVKVGFHNQVDEQSKAHFNKFGSNINELEVKYVQNHHLIEENQQGQSLVQLRNHKRFENILKDAVRIDDAGIAVKAYITFVTKERAELRLDFKFPASSLSSFGLSLNDLVVVKC